jgi:hypothetical protein
MTLDSQQYANLSDHSYGRDQRGNADIDLGGLVGKTVTMDDGVKYKILAMSISHRGIKEQSISVKALAR